MLAANSPISGWYQSLRRTEIGLHAGEFVAGMPALAWVNQGLMALFFLAMTLEIKRQIKEGRLASARRAALPVVAALGGIAVPALLYLLVAGVSGASPRAWAVPTATDVVLALGVLYLLGNRVPAGVKAFVAALAVVDDVAGIAIIALVYGHGVGVAGLASLAAAGVALLVLNRLALAHPLPYLAVGAALWLALLGSGLHATLAGVAVGAALPMRQRGPGRRRSPVRSLESRLHGFVVFAVAPLFAFLNAGVELRGVDPGSLSAGVPIAVAVALTVGKPLGILSATGLAVAAGLGRLPRDTGPRDLVGGALAAGVGFTVSLFLVPLALPPDQVDGARIGVLAGSAVSAGLAVVAFGVARRRSTAPPGPAIECQANSGGSS
jgi:NhaA family Na+:H+ antiporter